MLVGDSPCAFADLEGFDNPLIAKALVVLFRRLSYPFAVGFDLKVEITLCMDVYNRNDVNYFPNA